MADTEMYTKEQISLNVNKNNDVQDDIDYKEELKMNPDAIATNTDELHFLIINIGHGEGFTASVCDRKFSDPYCIATWGDNNTARTHVEYECSDGKPQWSQYKRFVIDPDNLPDIITVECWDKNDNPNENDEKYGSYNISCSEQKLFTGKQNVIAKHCAINKNGTKLHVRVGYVCCSYAELTSHANKCNKMNWVDKIQSKETLKWLQHNTDLYRTLCEQLISGMQLTSSNFGNVEFPPKKFEFICHFRNFAKLYATNNDDKMQIYYQEPGKILYAINPKDKDNDNIFIGGIEITNQVHLLWRYVFLKDHLLAGQDSEFNIYKSYIFDPNPQKLIYSLIAVIAQLALTSAIGYEVLDAYWFGFDDPNLSDVSHSIRYLSILIFILLSVSTNRTTQLYLKFYEEVGAAFYIPWYIIIVDFISNVFISITITLISFLFLVQSETYSDLVLNAFALTFISEIDDFINTYENDEAQLIQQDLREFLKTDCAVPRVVEYDIRDFTGVLLAPVSLLISIWRSMKAFVNVFIVKRHRNILTMDFTFERRKMKYRTMKHKARMEKKMKMYNMRNKIH